MKSKTTVLGSGSWATAIVKMLTENLTSVGWYVRREEQADHIEQHGHNPDYLSQVEFNTDKLKLFTDMNSAIAESDYLIFAIPSAFLHREMQQVTSSLKDKFIISAIKGIIPENGLIVGEYFHRHHEVPYSQIGVITGPCHAEEVAMERLSYLTAASHNEELVQELTRQLQSDYIKVTPSDDIIGTEYAAVLKNIYALAAGIAHGLGYGDNYQAVLMSNAIREMKRFTKKIWKIKRDINKSAYLGDLLVTGYSIFSRNRTFGSMIGQGYTVQSAMTELKMVAEGYYATKSAYEINKKLQARTPIIDAVYQILYLHSHPGKTFKKLSDELD
jgi:glycerol-3-phosphate dehydrogenase (NAD(P)+)